MSFKKAIKKMIVVLGLAHKTDDEKITKYEEVIAGLDANIPIFGVMTPTTASTTVKINFVVNEMSVRDGHIASAHTLALSIFGHMNELNDIYVDNYLPVIQTKAAGDSAKVALVHLTTKADAGVNPDEIPEVENLSITTGHVNRSFDVHWDTLDKKKVRGYNVMISVNPTAPVPLYTLYLFTKKSKCIIKDQILGTDVGIKIVSLGKKDGVQSDGSNIIIRKVVNPHN